MFDDSSLREEFLSSSRVFNGVIINVDHWQVRLPDGNTALREIVRHNGAVAVVPLDADGNVTLVRQHRVAIDRMTWEIPAGKLDSPDEDPFSAAKRELEEETGLRAATWRLLTSIDTTPGYCTERIALYLATDLTHHTAHTDQDEFLTVSKMPLNEAIEKVMTGEFQDSKTIIGLLMAQQHQALHTPPRSFDPSSIKRLRSGISSAGAEKISSDISSSVSSLNHP